jgi:hypothetical protein
MILQDHGEVRRELPGPVISWLGPTKAAIKLHTLLDLRGSIADPKHERHAELKEWWGSEPFDPDTVDTAPIENVFANLARRSSKSSRFKQ